MTSHYAQSSHEKKTEWIRNSDQKVPIEKLRSKVKGNFPHLREQRKQRVGWQTKQYHNRIVPCHSLVWTALAICKGEKKGNYPGAPHALVGGRYHLELCGLMKQRVENRNQTVRVKPEVAPTPVTTPN